jgi:hypothetical protein
MADEMGDTNIEVSIDVTENSSVDDSVIFSIPRSITNAGTDAFP